MHGMAYPLSRYAQVAKPRPKPRSQRSTSSGTSSGDQTVVFDDSMMMLVEDILFTQSSVEKTFSNGNKVMDVMLEIANGEFRSW